MITCRDDSRQNAGNVPGTHVNAITSLNLDDLEVLRKSLAIVKARRSRQVALARYLRELDKMLQIVALSRHEEPL